MNSLSWFLYLGAVSGQLSTLFSLVGVLMMVSGAVSILPGRIIPWNNPDHPENVRTRNFFKKWSAIGTIFGFVMVSISIFIPDQRTVYLIAASEVGNQVVTSEEGQELYGELKTALKGIIQNLGPKEKNEQTILR